MSSGAVFTMRLKDVFKATGGTWDSSSGLSVLSGGDIGLDNYPLFTDGKPRTGTGAIPDYRPTINGKIFDHYMNREIGVESIGMFQLFMRRKMNEIMPFFNQMYLSLAVEIEPLSTVNLITDNTMNDTQTAVADSTTDSTSNTTGAARAVNSDTPQTMLSGNEDYASSAADTNSQNDSTGNVTQNNTSTTTDAATGNTHITGYQGAASDLLIRYRDSFINPDMMVISELEELFMQVWDNGDSFTGRTYNQFEGLYY